MAKKKTEGLIDAFNKKYNTQVDLIHIFSLFFIFFGLLFYWYFMIYIQTNDMTLIFLSMFILAACATLVWVIWLRYIERLKTNDIERYNRLFSTENLGRKFWYLMFFFMIICTLLAFIFILAAL